MWQVSRIHSFVQHRLASVTFTWCYVNLPTNSLLIVQHLLASDPQLTCPCLQLHLCRWRRPVSHSSTAPGSTNLQRRAKGFSLPITAAAFQHRWRPILPWCQVAPLFSINQGFPLTHCSCRLPASLSFLASRPSALHARTKGAHVLNNNRFDYTKVITSIFLYLRCL